MNIVVKLSVLSALAVTLAACGKEVPPAVPLNVPTSPPPTAVVNSGGSTISASELDSIKKSEKSLKFVLIVKTRNNPFFDPMIRAFEAECTALGVTSEVQAPPQEGDKELQFSYVENVAAKGADAILIAPADSKAIVPALKKAVDKGILVVNIDNRVDVKAAKDQSLNLGGYVGADNEAGGKLAGAAMAKALGGKGKLGVLEGIRGADNAEARKKGFEAGAKGMEIVSAESAEWNMDKANAKAQAMLAAHPEIAGVFCANDMMALGAIKAIKQAGKTGKITVFGYDNIPAIKTYLQSGEIAGSVEQHPDLMGKYGVRMALGILNKTVASGKEFLVPLEVKGK